MSTRWGQLFMVGLPGLELDATSRYLIADLQVGGIILFQRNIAHPRQVAEFIQACQKLAVQASGQPLLVAVDQEGGPVQRLRQPFPEMPSARQFGDAGDLPAMEAAARQVGRELRALGITINLAPVLDVPRNAACPLWERAYSTDPEKVALWGLTAVRGYQAGGVLPVVKHFPGLGATELDSHLELPVAAGGPERRAIDLLPFRRAVAAAAPGVMAAHVVVPEWDSRPASLSQVAISRILRGELGFTGLAFTDDLEMGAVAKHWPVAEAAKLAVAAGQDILLICQEADNVAQSVALLEKSPELEEARESAWRRIMHVKRRLLG